MRFGFECGLVAFKMFWRLFHSVVADFDMFFESLKILRANLVILDRQYQNCLSKFAQPYLTKVSRTVFRVLKLKTADFCE